MLVFSVKCDSLEWQADNLLGGGGGDKNIELLREQ
jgi:hypothetical protein